MEQMLARVDADQQLVALCLHGSTPQTQRRGVGLPGVQVAG